MRVRCCRKATKTAAWVPVAAPYRLELALVTSPRVELMQLPVSNKHKHHAAHDNPLPYRSTSTDCQSELSLCPEFPSDSILRCMPALTSLFSICRRPRAARPSVVLAVVAVAAS